MHGAAPQEWRASVCGSAAGVALRPIVGLITKNIYHAGKLVIPAGTEVHGTAQTDRHRERIASGGSWTLVWQGGEERRLKAIALDRKFSCDQEGWGITDGSAGLRGRIIKSDDMAENAFMPQQPHAPVGLEVASFSGANVMTSRSGSKAVPASLRRE